MSGLEKSLEKVNKDFFIGIFVQLFTAHLLKKNRDFIASLRWRYMRTNKCRKTFGTPGNIDVSAYRTNFQEKIVISKTKRNFNVLMYMNSV